MAGLLVQEKTGGRVTGTGKDKWQGYWLLIQDTTGCRVTGTGYDRW